MKEISTTAAFFKIEGGRTLILNTGVLAALQKKLKSGRKNAGQQQRNNSTCKCFNRRRPSSMRVMRVFVNGALNCCTAKPNPGLEEKKKRNLIIQQVSSLITAKETTGSDHGFFLASFFVGWFFESEFVAACGPLGEIYLGHVHLWNLLMVLL